MPLSEVATGICSASASATSSADAPEARKGFLLNHLISELLPPKGDGLRWSNSDPITGQAAWFDLRVSIRKTGKQAFSSPQFAPLSENEPKVRVLRYGAKA